MIVYQKKSNEWLEKASPEELIEQFHIASGQLRKHKIFSVSYFNCKEELDIVQSEMIKRMRAYDNIRN